MIIPLTIRSADKGERATCKWLVPAAGNTHIRYTPTIQGMESFKGRLIHTADWPTEPVDFAGKRVAIVGTRALPPATAFGETADYSHPIPRWTSS